MEIVLLIVLVLQPCLGQNWMWEGGNETPDLSDNSEIIDDTLFNTETVDDKLAERSRENDSRLFFVISKPFSPFIPLPPVYQNQHHQGHHHGRPQQVQYPQHNKPCPGVIISILTGQNCMNSGFNPGGPQPTGPSLVIIPNNPTGAVPTTTTTTTRTTTTTASTTINYNIGPIIAPASVSNCTCVESYRCDAADIHQFGNGMIDPRRLCISGDVCCTKPKPATTVAPATTVKPTSAPLTGCGVANPEGIGLTRVTSDTLTAYGEFPWMTAVLENVGGGRLFICGGTLIHPRAVLTAAHCLQNKAQENIVVRLGEWDAASTNELYPTQEITALKVILHPEFYAGALFNDVAVIILSSDADTSRPNIRFSCLPSASDQYHRDKCISLGWGKQNFNDPGFSAILKKVLVPVVQHGDCQTTLQGTRLGKTFRLHEKFMCAGKNGADACTGDGGGPLMCPLSNQPKRFIQVGVTSWGIGCGTSPGVYSDLTQLEPWIQSTLNSNT